MSIQNSLNKEAFEQLPMVSKALKSAKTVLQRGNIEQYVLRYLMNINPCLNAMTDKQKKHLDMFLFSVINDRGWLE